MDETFIFPIARLIEQQGKANLTYLVRKTHLAKQTLFNNLKKLVKEGYLTKQTVVYGQGRPAVMYSRTEKPLGIMKLEKEYIPFVYMEFRKLKSLCRFEKGGLCKKSQKSCNNARCPMIIKS